MVSINGDYKEPEVTSCTRRVLLIFFLLHPSPTQPKLLGFEVNGPAWADQTVYHLNVSPGYRRDENSGPPLERIAMNGTQGP